MSPWLGRLGDYSLHYDVKIWFTEESQALFKQRKFTDVGKRRLKIDFKLGQACSLWPRNVHVPFLILNCLRRAEPKSHAVGVSARNPLS